VNRGRHFTRFQLGHAAMIEGTDAQLTRTAGQRLLQVNGPRMVGFRPGNVRGAKERDDRLVKSGGEVARSAVGRHQGAAAPHERLGEAKRQWFFGERMHAGTGGKALNLGSQFPFGGAAQHDDSAAALIDEILGKPSEGFGGPVLGRPEGGAGIETHPFGRRVEPPLLQQRVSGFLVGGSREQCESMARVFAAGSAGQAIVVVDDWRGRKHATFVSQWIERIRQKPTAAITAKADPPLTSR
jgi:hypothetical protein